MILGGVSPVLMLLVVAAVPACGLVIILSMPGGIDRKLARLTIFSYAAAAFAPAGLSYMANGRLVSLSGNAVGLSWILQGLAIFFGLATLMHGWRTGSLKRPTVVWWLLFTYWAVSVVSTLVNPLTSSVSVGVVTPLIVWSAVLFCGVPAASLVLDAWWALSAVCFVSLLAFFSGNPAAGIDATRIITLVSDHRLAGITAHPNAMAAVSGAVLVVAVSGRVSRRASLLVGVFALTSLVLSEARTVWLAAAVGVAIALLGRRASKGLLARIIGVVVASGVLVGAWTLLHLLRELASPTDLATANGRSFVWEYSWTHWSTSPWLGHGPSVFDYLTRHSGTLPAWADHAHNQLLQDLMTRGVFAAATSIALVAVLLWHATRGLVFGDGLGLGLVVVVVTPWVVDIGIDMTSPAAADVLLMLLILGVAASLTSPSSKASAEATSAISLGSRR